MKSFINYIEEGVNDPAIFKAVFMAGGPGSGKSFMVGKTALPALGMRIISSDTFFERQLEKAGLEPTPENIFSPKGQELRGLAKKLTKKQQEIALNGRLGLVIDGTGKNHERIRTQKVALEKLGYETMMIFVNTNIETAINRNRMRKRKLADDAVKKMWHEVQDNMGKFQTTFGNRFVIVDNSEGTNYKTATMAAYKKASQWTRREPGTNKARNWIEAQKKSRGIRKGRM